MFRHPKENMYFKPPTGIGRGRKSGGIKRSSGEMVIDKSKYEPPQVYQSTSEYKAEVVEDPNGTGFMKGEDGDYIRDENGNIKRFSRKETYAENPGFRVIRSAPLGTMIVIHNPQGEWTRGIGKVPEHDEFYEVTQRTRTIRAVKYRGTTDKRGFYNYEYGIDRENRFGDGMGGDIKSIKEIQHRFKYAMRITIYKPKQGE